MKAAHNLILLLFYLCESTSQNAPPQGNSSQLTSQNVRLFPIEKGMVRYETDGQPNDTLLIVFDRFGWRQTTAEFGEKVYYGHKTKINTREITDGEMMYKLNLSDKKGSYSNYNPMVKLASYKGPEELLEASMSKIGATKTERHSELLGQNCEVWEYTDKGKTFEIWTWEGLILKKQALKGSISAVEIKIQIPIDEKWFLLPSGIIWQSD